MNINQIQDALIEEFASLKDWFTTYDYLIKLGEQLPPLAEMYRTKAHLISGCQSRLWLAAECHDGKVDFYADSDTKITRGIIAVMLKVVNHRSPTEILAAELYFLDAIGLSSNLSPSRANGLASIIRRIHELTLRYNSDPGCPSV